MCVLKIPNRRLKCYHFNANEEECNFAVPIIVNSRHIILNIMLISMIVNSHRESISQIFEGQENFVVDIAVTDRCEKLN